MANVIFGSGIVGLLARKILGSSWRVVPFARSRFYSFSPPLADNFIVRDEKIDDIMAHLGAKPSHMYKLSYSVMGQLQNYNDALSETWLTKVFGPEEIPPQARSCMKDRNAFFAYDLRVNQLYKMLQNEYGARLQQDVARVTEIGDHYYVINGQRHEFDRAISTIPIQVLTKLARLGTTARALQVWYYHIKTTDLDFEGANQTLVVDPEFDFYRVTNIAKNRYLFYFLKDLQTPGPYFMQFMSRFDILDGTTIKDALPVGPIQANDLLNKWGITPVGAHAEHDWFADIGSNIMRILRITK